VIVSLRKGFPPPPSVNSICYDYNGFQAKLPDQLKDEEGNPIGKPNLKNFYV
jgi:hypothetical protein